MPEESTRFLPVSAVATVLSKHPLTIARYCREGRFASACRAEDGRRWLIAEAEILSFLEQAKARQKWKDGKRRAVQAEAARHG